MFFRSIHQGVCYIMDSDDKTLSVVVVVEEHSQRISELEARVAELTKEKTTTKRSEKEKLRYQLKRDEINAKRRAAYKAKKEAVTGTS